MAAKEVIHFPFGVQLFARRQFPALVLPEPVAELKARPRRRPTCVLVSHRKGRILRTDIYIELYLWNKNVDSLLRVLQRLRAFRILPEQTLKECEIRLEELGSALNVRLLETMLTREQTDHWRFSRLREVLDDASRNERVQ